MIRPDFTENTGNAWIVSNNKICVFHPEIRGESIHGDQYS